ncbi:hypothetical protein HO173_010871 [Letharia columbiana]|uniref:Uncharacterized protein n=1 Tax=Letharia columbiana TaxID=112416 RepID=A0A8H6FLZ4_9LECA|nr:uncharacterized protein HO173_010871 [Letharia columbiana]KAF6230963.1 hypothetical protein HO173_010871 [Letharia columbiana]
MGEVFRDIAAIAPHIASSDTVIVRPYLTPQCAPTLEEYLGACRHGDKAKLQKTFMNALTVCSQQKSIDKLIIDLASPLRGELSRFVKSGAGINWLRRQNRFIKRIMGQVRIRHSDINHMNKLTALGSGNQENIANLF